ncbi:MAG: iron-only hydrogenase system regulator [Desulfobacterales bacterium]|nr:iron-only hydrogenase system regulator [Desulfobacterales bacterium]MDD4072628.1 iron-only hydrogenase system regulator [Desulfobacterales bacterium]MDD4393997.1 iron-only hydrogenase system regulator [Desulfobacterales bacterium]
MIIGIIIKNRKSTAGRVNEILSDYGHIIIGRMGIPYKEKNISVVSLIIEATTDELGALTGKLGNLFDVQVKSNLV